MTDMPWNISNFTIGWKTVVDHVLHNEGQVTLAGIFENCQQYVEAIPSLKFPFNMKQTLAGTLSTWTKDMLSIENSAHTAKKYTTKHFMFKQFRSVLVFDSVCGWLNDIERLINSVGANPIPIQSVSAA